MRVRKTAVTVGIGSVVLVSAAIASSAPAGASERPHAGSTIGKAPATTPTGASPAAASPAADGKVVVDIQRGDTLAPGDRIISTGYNNPGTNQTTSYFGTYVLLQDDGNLVEYLATTGQALWNSGTAGAGATTLTFQDDGNVVLTDKSGAAIWSTLTYGTDAQYFYPFGNGTVITSNGEGTFYNVAGPAIAGEFGQIYAYGYSPDDRNQLIVQDDGNVVAYDSTGRAYWSTGTNGAGRVIVLTQDDGNFVVYQASTGRAIWSSDSTGQGDGATQLDIQNDGNIVLYGLGDGAARVVALWQSGTVR